MRNTLILLLVYSSSVFATSWSELDKRWHSLVSVKLNTHFKADIRYDKTLEKDLLIGSFYYLSKDFGLLKDCVFLQKKKNLSLLFAKVPLAEECSINLKNTTQTNAFFNFSLSSNSKNLIIEADTKKIMFQKMRKNKIMASFSKITGEKIPTGEFCYKVDSSCNVEQDNLCHFCQSGSYPVINSNCKSAYSMKCGVTNCGVEGASACIKGWIASNYKLDYCINDSPVAFCKEGLRVMCINEELVCR